MRFTGLLLLTLTSVLAIVDREVYDANGKYLYSRQTHPYGNTRDSGACDRRWQDSWDACARCKRGYTRVGLTDYCCTHGDAKAIPKKCIMDRMCYTETKQAWQRWDENPCMHPTEMSFIYIGTNQYCCSNGFDGKKGATRYYTKQQMQEYFSKGGKTTQAPLNLPRERCGYSYGVANMQCSKSCSTGRDCPKGERCYKNLDPTPCKTGELDVGFELMNAQQATEFSATDIMVYGFAVVGLVAIVGGAHRLLKKKNDQTVEFSEL